MDKHEDTMAIVQQVGALEDELKIPERDRLTSWFGDYCVYEPILGLSVEDLRFQQRMPVLLEMKKKRTEFEPVFLQMHKVFEETRSEALSTIRSNCSLSGAWCSILSLSGHPETYVRYTITGYDREQMVLSDVMIVHQNTIRCSMVCVLAAVADEYDLLFEDPTELEDKIRQQFQEFWNGESINAYSSFYTIDTLKKHATQLLSIGFSAKPKDLIIGSVCAEDLKEVI